MRFVLVIVMLSALLSCSSHEDVPAGIIPVTQMKFIMFDVISAQEFALIRNPKDSNAARQKTFELCQQVFDIYKINRSDFFKSFNYYESNPDKLKILSDSLYAYGARKRQEIYLKMQ